MTSEVSIWLSLRTLALERSRHAVRKLRAMERTASLSSRARLGYQLTDSINVLTCTGAILKANCSLLSSAHRFRNKISDQQYVKSVFWDGFLHSQR